MRFKPQAFTALALLLSSTVHAAPESAQSTAAAALARLKSNAGGQLLHSAQAEVAYNLVRASGAQLLTACVAGYEVGIRVGEFLGRSHYRIFHTTGTAGTLAAAAAVGHLLGLNAQQMQHAFGSAGTQSASSPTIRW